MSTKEVLSSKLTAVFHQPCKRASTTKNKNHQKTKRDNYSSQVNLYLPTGLCASLQAPTQMQTHDSTQQGSNCMDKSMLNQLQSHQSVPFKSVGCTGFRTFLNAVLKMYRMISLSESRNIKYIYIVCVFYKSITLNNI